MTIGVLQLEIGIGDAMSLKDKRRVVKSLKDRIAHGNSNAPTLGQRAESSTRGQSRAPATKSRPAYTLREPQQQHAPAQRSAPKRAVVGGTAAIGGYSTSGADFITNASANLCRTPSAKQQ